MKYAMGGAAATKTGLNNARCVACVGLLEYKAQLFARQMTDYLISTHLEYKAR